MSAPTTECVFCTALVGAEGETCSLDCYKSWYAWALTMVNGHNEGLCKLQDDDKHPLPLSSQPWLNREIEMEDYL